MPSFPKLTTRPALDPATTIAGDNWRIGVITESLIRLEWQDDGFFEDRATQTVTCRNWDTKPEFTKRIKDDELIVETPHLRLTYDMQPFSKEGLSVVVKGLRDSQRNTWNFGAEPVGNLKGTARTLDKADGEIPLGQGIISRNGWALLDDSSSNELVETDSVQGQANPFGMWVEPRNHKGIDLYIFAYGHRYIEAIQDFYRLTGQTPLLPRFAFGNWWSRYHKYSSDEYLDLMQRFEKEGIPFNTAVIDMDWHRVDDIDPKYGSGWTGYTWNRKLFPNPEKFMDELHQNGMKVTLNIHPRDGIRAFEDCYPEIARKMGVDSKSEEPIVFDPSSPKFMQTYFNLHHHLEDEGVSFWWIDWQQGGVTRQKGLDPLWILNHLHYLDSGRDGRWPITFSRYAGPGSHRYPVGFSGDTVVSWKSLQFQPYFTATASNIGYGWWSHDIGGHMFGYRDEELEARWYQLGTFSPINRLHSTDSPFNGKEPWNFHTETRLAMTEALRLRQQLIPYLYSMNWRAHVDGRPLVEPMYWQSPEIDDAYRVDDEFRFGSQLVVAPIVTPQAREVQKGSARAWLPQGQWFDFFTGKRYDAPAPAGRNFELWRDLADIPVFAKAGAIVPMQTLDETNGPVNNVKNPKHLEIVVFPGDDGRFDLIEDDGVHTNGSVRATTALRLNVGNGNGGNARFTIGRPQGNTSCLPATRDWTVVFRGIAKDDAAPIISVDGKKYQTAECRYDDKSQSLSVALRGIARDSDVSIDLDSPLRPCEENTVEDAMKVLYDAQINYLAKEKAYDAIRQYGKDGLTALHALQEAPGDLQLPDTVIRAVSEQLLRTV
ncbi:glycoside hydrolase family 31 protein [Bifidobacterium sp. ESL0784]|uniref:glycoside hydrolase family 31 protein n=1 Tax=Bifidobacterium sp. ESL0784 TaxID=2983231 RepID=UPI0023F969C2|nr:TIM-barrel domain-containing protein [Bifidobacterium sp. ESL0784]MDF7640799.1 glycoside hydrolase family 31 protein [Bifidobacterium sp. ESL0784]